jgi:hypothetical protein
VKWRTAGVTGNWDVTPLMTSRKALGIPTGARRVLG